MDEILKQNLDKLSDNRMALLKKMFWNTAPSEEAMMCSMLHISSKRELSLENYDSCKKILKEHAGVFSEFRGNAMTLVITKMMLSDSPEEFVVGAMEVYKKLIARHRFASSSYTVMAAINIYEKGGTLQADHYLDLLDDLYATLKKDHPWLVSNQDYGYLSMLVCADLNVADLMNKTEEAYQMSKDITLDKNCVYSLAQVLSLCGDEAKEKVSLVKEILARMAEAGHPLSKTNGLPSVGALSMLSMPTDQIIRYVTEADDYLKTKKGFRINGGKFRRIIASLMVFITYVDDENIHLAGNISSALTMQIIEEIIMMMILITISASTAAATSASH